VNALEPLAVPKRVSRVLGMGLPAVREAVRLGQLELGVAVHPYDAGEPRHLGGLVDLYLEAAHSVRLGARPKDDKWFYRSGRDARRVPRRRRLADVRRTA